MRVKDLINTYADWSGQTLVGVYIETGDIMPVFIGHLLITEIAHMFRYKKVITFTQYCIIIKK